MRILIQNVSSQCIPNLVAARAFRPDRIVWVYTPEFGDALNRMRAATQRMAPAQENWRVDARDVVSMHRALKKGFATLPPEAEVIFHLTGGTKSMALQGLFNLGAFRRRHGARVRGVVMDPRTQTFDQIYPDPVNGLEGCPALSLKEILAVHGNKLRDAGLSFERLRARKPMLDRLRGMAAKVRRAMGDRTVRRDGDWFWLPGGPLPKAVRRAIRQVEEMGAVRGLQVEAERGRVRWKQADFEGDLFAYVRNKWMEDWVGAVLAAGISGWRGGGCSVRVEFDREGRDTQEFDVLGARANRLVYWSCKHVRQMSSPVLFEVDALRDEIGGRDHHMAGVACLAWEHGVGEGMLAKAGRLGVRLVDVAAPDAEEQILKASGG